DQESGALRLHVFEGGCSRPEPPRHGGSPEVDSTQEAEEVDMSTVARRVRATPERSAIYAWKFIQRLISEVGSDARKELDRVAGVAASLIADEAPKDHPIVVSGSGPRLRVYCLYGEDAVTGDGNNEESLTRNPTAGDWRMS